MGKIYILGNKKNTDWELVPVPLLTTNEFSKIHDFVVCNLAKASSNDKVVIDLDSLSESTVGLLIALHIRLSILDLGQTVLMPIVFVSSLPLQSFLRLGECSQIFLTLSGVAFCQPDMVKDSIEALEGLSVESYKSDFLDQIQIHPDAETGSHSMANQWGADVFNRIISKDDRVSATDLIRAKKKLYFKYVFANTVNLKVLFEGVSDYAERKQQVQIATGKNILLIDDEAEKGWSDVLKKWFVGLSSFDVINEEIGCYDDIPNEIQCKIDSDYYDLYLLDLRLLGTKEDNIYSTDDFSGMKILKAIKEKNRGNQVIILTASNKAWNMKALLDEGADGYYIKESPELKLPEMFSQANFKSFKNDVDFCFANSFKKKTYRQMSALLSKIKTSSKISNTFTDELSNSIEGSLYQIINSKSNIDFAYSYISLFQSFEIIGREYLIDDPNGDWSLEMYNYDNNGIALDKITKENTKFPPILSKLVAIYHHIGNQTTDANYIRNLNILIKRRNAFVHKLPELEYPINQKIYNKDGFQNLLDVVIRLIESLI